MLCPLMSSELQLDMFCDHLQQIKEMLIGLQFPSFAFIKAFNSQSVTCSQVQFTLLFHGFHFLIVGHNILSKKDKQKMNEATKV